VGRDRTFDQGDPRNGVGIGRHAQAGGVTTPLYSGTDKDARRSARFSFVCLATHYHRHCEPTGRANARPMTGSAKQSIAPQKKNGLLRCARNDV
jgi:hypothetical protein